MKKADPSNRKNTHKNVQGSQQKAQGSRGGRLATSVSLECLSSSSTSEMEQRKASTPTHSRTIVSNTPDVSIIEKKKANKTVSGNELHQAAKDDFNQPGPSGTRVAGGAIRRTGTSVAGGARRRTMLPDSLRTARSKTSKDIQKELSMEEQLDIKYVQTLQAMFKNELLKARCSKLENEIKSVQQKIVEDEKILKTTRGKLKNIAFNKEVDALYELHKPRFEQVVGTLDETNFEEHISTLNSKLEQTQNQLKIKNIETPQGAGAQVMEEMTNTLLEFEKLGKTDETPKILKEIKEINKRTVNTFTSTIENLAPCEELLLNRAVLEMSTEEKPEVGELNVIQEDSESK